MAQQKQDNTPLFVMVGLTLFFYNEIFGKSEEEKKAEEEQRKIENVALESNPFDYEHFKAKVPKKVIESKKYRITSPDASVKIRKAAGEVEKGWKFFDDDESGVINAIKQAKTKGDIALMSKYYSFDFKKDLLYDIKTKMSKAERGNIYTYVNKLPEYLPTK